MVAVSDPISMRGVCVSVPGPEGQVMIKGQAHTRTTSNQVLETSVGIAPAALVCLFLLGSDGRRAAVSPELLHLICGMVIGLGIGERRV